MKPLSLFDDLTDCAPGSFRRLGGRKSRAVLSKHAENHFDLDDRMTIVLFAGMGGGCDGLEEAGFHVHVAINHDPVAVAVHENRHPHTRHLRCDVFETDPRQVTRGRGVRVLHASPDCTHFSVAKGSKPVSKRRRSLAWVICRWMGTVEPEVVTMENVQEIMTWGPLIAKRDPATGRVLRLDGTVAAKGERVPVQEQWLVPDPRHKGRIWRAWLKHVERLGYHFEHRVLVCADYGVPTIRKRFFGVARKDGAPVVWPERTHAPRKDAKRLGLKPWVGAHTIIDWSLPVKSIFGRKKPLAEATLRRTARGVMRYVVDAAKPFIVPITHSGGDRVHDVGEPLRTLTTAHRGELAVMAPHVAKFRTGAVGTDVGEPLPTFTANSFEKRPGGAVPLGLVGASLIRTDQQSAAARNGVNDPAEPLNTLHTSSGMALVSAAIVGAGGRAAQSEPRGMEDPLGSTTTKEDRVLVSASLVPAGYGERDGQAPRSLDIEEPIGAQVAGGGKHALVAANLVGLAHGDSGGRREYDLEEPLGTVQAQGGNAALVAAFLAQHNGDPRDDGRNEARHGRTIEEPLGAVTTSPQIGVAAAFVAQHNTGEPGRSAEDPLSTIVTLGSTQGVVAATLGNMHGTNVAGRPIEDPLATISAGGSHAHLILGFLKSYFSTGGESNDHALDHPLTALTAKARHGLVEVMVRGVPHYIDDIGMRMLEPEEGAAAHGFKPGSLPDMITIDGKTRRLTKTEKYHLVGNSVPPKMIRLLAECNVQPAFAEAAE